MAEGEERAESAAEEHNVVAVVDGFGERVLVGIQGGQDVGEEGGGGGGVGCAGGILGAVELEQFGEKGEDEGEGDLGGGGQLGMLIMGGGGQLGVLVMERFMIGGLTRSRSREMKSTLSTFFRSAGDMAGACAIVVLGEVYSAMLRVKMLCYCTGGTV